MLLLFDAKGTPFVKELVRDGAAEVDGTIHVGDQVTCVDTLTHARTRARPRQPCVKSQNRREANIQCRPGETSTDA